MVRFTRAALAEATKADATSIGDQAGYTDPKINEREVHAGNLLSRGMATLKREANEIGKARWVYAITRKGGRRWPMSK
ncbi:MAG TPA: hypothetical protein VGG61_09270 [Gemmataceae bacterium]|jgi:hypothetical protein